MSFVAPNVLGLTVAEAVYVFPGVRYMLSLLSVMSSLDPVTLQEICTLSEVTGNRSLDRTLLLLSLGLVSGTRFSLVPLRLYHYLIIYTSSCSS
jgi:hypothetical protein